MTKNLNYPALFSIILMTALVCAAGCNSNRQNAPDKNSSPEIIYQEDFENSTLNHWFMTDTSAWALKTENENSFIALVQQSEYQPKYRSPHNISLVDTLLVNDFVLELKAQSTKEPYNHLDLCIFFGYQNPDNYYYVHLGAEADPNAHSIFFVNDSARTSIAEERTDKLDWGSRWHDIKVVRECESGLIEVYFDNMETPIMKAHNTEFTKGKIGVGSFDDTGNFDDIRISSF